MNKLKRCAALALAVLAGLLASGCGPEPSSSSSAPPPSSQSVPVPASQAQPGHTLQPLPLATDFNALTGLARPEGMQDGQRPVAVMVANSERSRPQRGLAAADVVVELVTEGGITRLMAMYADYRTVPLVGPVRSTRDQFVQLAYPENSILVHIGTSVYARNLLEVLGYKNVDGIQLGRTAFWFDDVRGGPGRMLNEYCWFTNAELIWKGMEFIDVVPTGEVRAMFNFADAPTPGQEEAATVYATYSGVAATAFVYDAASGLYTKMLGEAPHADEDGTPLTYNNVFLLRAAITLKPDGQCSEFDLSGGAGYYFSGGRMVPITWQKGAPENPLRLFDEAGNELSVARGKSYIGYVPASDEGAARWEPPVQAE